MKGEKIYTIMRSEFYVYKNYGWGKYKKDPNDVA